MQRPDSLKIRTWLGTLSHKRTRFVELSWLTYGISMTQPNISQVSFRQVAMVNCMAMCLW